MAIRTDNPNYVEQKDEKRDEKEVCYLHLPF